MSETCPECGSRTPYDVPLERPRRGQRLCVRCMRITPGGGGSEPFDPDSPIPVGSYVEWADDAMLAAQRRGIGRYVDRRGDLLLIQGDGQQRRVPVGDLFAIHRRSPDLPPWEDMP